MQNILIPLFELFLDPSTHSTFYQYLWQDDSWALWLGLSPVFISLIVLLVFYKFIDMALPKTWHWIVALIIIFGLEGGVSYYILYDFFDGLNGYGCILTPEDCGFAPGTSPQDNFLKIGLLMGVIAVLFGILMTIFLRKLSINNKRNPF